MQLNAFLDKLLHNGLGIYEVGDFGNRMFNVAPKLNRIPKAKIKHRSHNFIKPLLSAVFSVGS